MCVVDERALWLPYTDDAGKDGLLEVQRVDPGEGKGRSYFVDQDVLSGELSLLELPIPTLQRPLTRSPPPPRPRRPSQTARSPS